MEKKSNALNYVLYSVLILIVLVGLLFFLRNKDDDSDSGKPYTVYNNYIIYEDKDEKSLRYRVEVIVNGGNRYVHIFKKYPTDLLSIERDDNLREKILYQDFENSVKKSKIYFSYDPQMDGVEVLTAGTLVQVLGTSNAGIYKIPVIMSVSKQSDNPDFPLITCSDATDEVGVIEMRYGNPRIYIEGDCVVVQGQNREEFINTNDLLSYILLGVIEE